MDMSDYNITILGTTRVTIFYYGLNVNFSLKVTLVLVLFILIAVPLERIPMYSICFQGDITEKTFYLYSPGYPEDFSNNRHCECYTELNKPTDFNVFVHQGRFQQPELKIMFDNFVRRPPFSAVNLPIPKKVFKVVYENNKANPDHRLWMKISGECNRITLKCPHTHTHQSMYDVIPGGHGPWGKHVKLRLTKTEPGENSCFWVIWG
jgi:hypothetical protein